MTNAQTEARVIAQERIWVTGSFHMGGYASGSWNVQKLSNRRTDLGEVEYVRADIHATALAAKNAKLAAVKVSNNKWLAKWERAEAQLAEARKALKAIEKEAKKNKPDPDKIWDIARRAREAWEKG